ncbi:MAG: glycosyltransferase family 9 protein [Fimbriimonadaceae bacterium]|nr:glycosyltransferase family 9 protein [Fimbriimonadaceae bacterium]
MPRFLIARLSSLGDVVCGLPVAAALKAGYPDAVIDWAVDPRFAGLVECCGTVDRVLPVRPGFAPSTWPRLEEEYDAALDLQGLAKSAWVVARARAKRKLGYHWQREGSWLVSERILPDPSSYHVVDQYVDVARAAGGIADVAEFALSPDPATTGVLRDTLNATPGLDASRMVVLNAGAGWETKRWPAASFAFVAERLAEEGYSPVFVGGKQENALDEVLRTTSNPSRQRVIDFRGRTDVKQLVSLVSIAQATVAGDTGVSHLAAALGVPAVSMYAITRPQRCCPYGQAELCHYNPAGLAGIAPEEVWSTLRRVLADDPLAWSAHRSPGSRRMP